jgi:hypothetical protein
MIRYALFTPLALALALVPCGAESKPDADTVTRGAEFNFKFRDKGDRVRVSHTPDGVVFRVTCPSGISDVEVTLKEGDWPRHITLQLELVMLEAFGAENGKLKVGGNLREAGEQKGALWFNDTGERVKDQAKAVHAMKMKAAADGKQRVIEIALPAGFGAKDTKTLKIFWIDAFRG